MAQAKTVVRKEAVVTISKREIQTFQMIANGKTNEEIAEELDISERTVEGRISSVIAKTGCKNRTEVAMLFVRNGLIK
jgi:two-component system, NarL family, response regulator LiaR